MHPFRAAIEKRDVAAALGVFADGVVFNSPIVFRPSVGRDAVAAVLTAVTHVFEDFAYVSELTSEDGRDHALRFRARIDGLDVEGCDFLHDDADGRVDEITVMVRPLSAAHALRDRMAAQLAALPGS